LENCGVVFNRKIFEETFVETVTNLAPLLVRRGGPLLAVVERLIFDING